MENQLVIMHDQQAVTTSLKVAEVFEKNHRDVTRSIDGLKKDVRNFAQMFLERHFKQAKRCILAWTPSTATKLQLEDEADEQASLFE